MSEKYTAVCFITIKCTAELEPNAEGVRIRLLQDPKRLSDTTILVSKGQDVPGDVVLQAVQSILPTAIIQKEADLSALPPNVEEVVPVSSVAIKKEDLN